ncbi:MAG: hypothetical protein ABIP75_00200 [Pyrinomonadaceae bacterium]
MFKNSPRLIGALVLTMAATGWVIAQETKTITTTQVTQTTQNPDGTYTVIEYPADKEVVVNLSPTDMVPTARGVAKVHRSKDGTMIHLDLTGMTGETANYNLYAVDQSGKTTLLGPVQINKGVGTFETTTPMTQFMMVLSPQGDLVAYNPATKVVLRSVVPEGLAVVALSSSGEKDGAAVGEKVAATTTAVATPAYNVPMLGIPGFRRGTDTEVKINLSGPMTGSRANVSLEPRKDGPTTITMRFHELKESPANQVYVLWAVSPDNKYVRLGQIVNTGQRNEAEIKTETALLDFGLFITAESEFATPAGVIIGTIEK